MVGLQRLTAEHKRLLSEISRLGAPLGPFPAPRVEDVWRRLRSAGATVRLEVLPYLTAIEEVAGTALNDLGEDLRTVAVVRILRRDLEQELAQMDHTAQDLVDDEAPPRHLMDAARSIGAACAIATSALHVLDDVLLPQLRQAMTDHEADSLEDAMAAYERVLGDVS
jgi:hypothetical protein